MFSSIVSICLEHKEKQNWASEPSTWEKHEDGTIYRFFFPLVKYSKENLASAPPTHIHVNDCIILPQECIDPRQRLAIDDATMEAQNKVPPSPIFRQLRTYIPRRMFFHCHI